MKVSNALYIALACLFASCTLQPKKWLEEKWAEFQDLDKMVEIFQSPKSSLCISLKALGLLK